MYAHYFEGKGRKELIISETPDLRGYPLTVGTDVATITRVAGRRQAREIARQHNAKPWNF